MTKKSGGGAARGGKKREKRDREGGRDNSWKFASGSKALRLGQLGSDFVSAGYGEMYPGQHPYSLQDEARDTERHRSTLWSSSKLRNNKITFVSAGHFDAKKLMELDPSDTQDSRDTDGLAESLQEPATQLKGAVDGTPLLEDSRPVEADNLGDDNLQNTGISPPDDSETSTEALQDGCGTLNTQSSSCESGNATQVGLSPSVVRASSPTPSDSSQEVILFAGRNQDTNVANEQTARRPTSSRSILEESYGQDVSDNALQAGGMSGIIDSGKSSSLEMAEPEHSLPARNKMVIRDSRKDDAINDYMSNIKEYDNVQLVVPGTYTLRELDLEGWQEYETENEPSAAEGQTTAWRYAACGWGASDDQHPEVVSTSMDTFGDIDSILAKRSRPNGDQFLVQLKGHSINDVKWIPRTSLAAESQLKHIAAFEGAAASTYETEDSDEKLVRLFTKQNSLDMASEEFMGFSDTDETASDGDFITTSVSKGTKASRHRGDSSFAAQIANAYDDFDIMDFERPSLRKGKGRKAVLPFNLSDSELEANIRSTWSKDRKKKAERKRERAELRAQGIYGKYNATNPDIRAKYEQGMAAEELESEIKRFLASDLEEFVAPFFYGQHYLINIFFRLTFPPMERHRRKMLHEISAILNLKSKSVGSKVQRFTTFYKTSFSVSHPTDIERAFNQIRARGLLQRMGLRGKRTQRVKDSNVRPRNAWTGDSTARYRDGEIVGASAPELGSDNKGRQMLEKMGWSSGTALGALNNKGILQPVASVVKTTKAGLG